ASHGAPWIFRVVNAHLNSHVNERNAPPPLQRADLRDIILAHLDSLYSFYGEESGVRIARKHPGWYCELLDEPAQIRGELMGAARGRRAAVARRARLGPGQPEPRSRDPRHQSRHAAKETEAVRTSRLLTAECPRRYAAHSSRFPTRPASSSWRASSPGATS